MCRSVRSSKRAADAGAVALNLSGRAPARVAVLAQVTARAGVHRGSVLVITDSQWLPMLCELGVKSACKQRSEDAGLYSNGPKFSGR